jgi:hypothetical protein
MDMHSEIYLDANATSTLLIDVREACEHAAGTPALHGRASYNLPLSRLAEHASWHLAGGLVSFPAG